MGTVHALREDQVSFSDDGIKGIHAVSTGRCFQHKEHRFGSVLPQIWWVLTSRSWIEIPISVFVIEHKRGMVLFDTGLNPAVALDKKYISQAIGRFLLNRIFRFKIGAKDGLAYKLKSLGFDPRNVDRAIISHLHFDHVGGICDIPQADLLVSKKEWDQLSTRHPERDWILREHIELPGAKWRPIEFARSKDPLFSSFRGIYDVMSDGSLVCLPTPGHTPGSMSLLLRSAVAPPILLVGDLAYSADAIFNDKVPGTGDAKTLRRTYQKIRQLKAMLPDLLIIPSHDDIAVSSLRSAMSSIQRSPTLASQ